jgi:hypothetical protein
VAIGRRTTNSRRNAYTATSGGITVRILLILAAASAGLAAEPALAQAEGQVQALLTCAPLSQSAVHLKLVLLGAPATPAPEAVLVTFAQTPGGPPLNLPAPGPRNLSLPLKAPERSPGPVWILDLGEVSLAPPCPQEIEVRGGATGQNPATLGTLRRGREGAPATFARAYPGATSPPGSARLVILATYEPLEDHQFRIKLACFNCGAQLPADEDLFLHFELSPTGSDLPATTALGLLPDGRATDSASWSEGDLAVAQFGPYSMPEGLPEFVYLRAGLYNRQGDGARVPVASPDDTSRALVGRLVTRDGKTRFEPAPIPGTAVPTGWAAAKGASK